MFELEELKQKSLAVKLGIPAVYGGADVNTQPTNSSTCFPAMPLNHNDVLRPLGGEDNLRLMCDVRDFHYTPGSDGFFVTFNTPTYTVDIGCFPNPLSGGDGWCMKIWTKYRIRKIHHSDYISSSELVVRTFEWATEYTLKF